MSGFIEFVLFVVVLILIFWIASINNRVHELEARLRSQGLASAPPRPAPRPPTEAEYNAALQQPEIHHTPFPSHREPEARTFQAPVSARPEERHSEMNTDRAISWLNKIGVAALVLGVAFFYKIAVDMGWINEWVRIALGLAVGGLLIYLGELWKERYGNYALAITGGGIALLYFTLYAGFHFYGLLPQPLAFVLMLGVAALSVWLAYRHSSLALGALAFFGAYGSPLVLSTGHDQQGPLLIYLTLLNIAVLVVLARKYWLELMLLALVGATLDFAVWGSAYSNAGNTYPSLFFIIFTSVLFVLGLGFLTRYHHAQGVLPKNFEKDASIVATLSGLFYFISIALLLNENYHSLLAPVALLGGVLFLFAYALVDRLEYRMLNYGLSIVGAVMLVCAAGWEWQGKALALAWLALGLFGITIGALLKREELRMWSVVILFLALFKSVVEPYTSQDLVFLFNAKFGLMFADTLALLYAGWLYSRYPDPQTGDKARDAMEIVAILVLWAGVSWDIAAALVGTTDLARSQWMALWWVLYPALLLLIAALAKRKLLMATAAILLVFSLVRVLVLPYDANPVFLMNTKFELMVLEAAALLFAAYIYRRGEGQNQLSDVFNVGASLLLWLAVSWEIVEHYRGFDSKNARNLILSLWWIVYSAVMMFWGVFRNNSLLKKLAVVLFAVTILKVFLYDLLVLDLSFRVVSFIALGFILVGVSIIYRRHREQIIGFLQGKET